MIKFIKLVYRLVLIIIGVCVNSLIMLNECMWIWIILIMVKVSFVIIVYMIYKRGVVNMNINLIGFVMFVKKIVSLVEKNIEWYFECLLGFMLWYIVKVILISDV